MSSPSGGPVQSRLLLTYLEPLGGGALGGLAGVFRRRLGEADLGEGLGLGLLLQNLIASRQARMHTVT